MDSTRIEKLSKELHGYIQADYTILARKIMKGLSVNEMKAVVSCKVNNKPALFSAVLSGSEEMVDFLLGFCKADVNEKGEFHTPERNVTVLATPLWCAATENKIDIAKTLVKHGADINDGTDTVCSPVWSACNGTHIEMVEYLVELGADINVSNLDGYTCLMNSVYSVELCEFLVDTGAYVNTQTNNGDTALHMAVNYCQIDTLKYLIKKGASVNVQDSSGNTPLHDAVANGQLEIVKHIAEAGADPWRKNTKGSDCLQLAALEGFENILDFFVEKFKCTKRQQIDLYELLGCCYVDKKNNISEALNLWKKTMAIRFSPWFWKIRKTKTDPNPAYLNMTEAQTMVDLENLEKKEPEAVYMEALMIRERILGTKDEHVIHWIWRRGHQFYKNNDFLKAICLSKYSYQLASRAQPLLHLQRLRNLYYLFDYICKIKSAAFSCKLEILRFVVQEAHSAQDVVWLQPICPKLQDEYETLLKVLLLTVYVLCLVNVNDEENRTFREYIKTLAEMDIKSSEDQLLLHLAVNSRTSKLNRHGLSINDSTFPSSRVTKLFVECGMSVNVTDANLDTPLHVLAESYMEDTKPTKKVEEYRAITEYLVSAGTDVNAYNSRGETAGQAVSKMFPDILK